MGKYTTDKPVYRQVKDIQLGKTVSSTTGAPMLAILMPEAHVYVAYSSPDALEALGKAISAAAAQLHRDQRGSVISTPSAEQVRNVTSSKVRSTA